MPLSQEFLRSLKSREYTGRWRLSEKKVGPPWKPRHVWAVQVEIRSTYIHMRKKTPMGETLEWSDASIGDLVCLGLADKLTPRGTTKSSTDPTSEVIIEH